MSSSGFRAWWRRVVGGKGEEGVALLRQLRRLHQVDPAAVPVHGRVARRVPPGVPELRQVRPERPPARLPVYGPHPQLLPAALQRRRDLTYLPADRPADPSPTYRHHRRRRI
jgi:hypothetical protein